jgi:hypothetical protein
MLLFFINCSRFVVRVALFLCVVLFCCLQRLCCVVLVSMWQWNRNSMCIAIDWKTGEFIEGKLYTFFGTGHPASFIKLKIQCNSIGRKVPGSISGGATGDFFFVASDKSMCPGSTQPLKMSTRILLGVKTAGA